MKTKCQTCKGTTMFYKWQTKGKGVSPSMKYRCSKNHKPTVLSTSQKRVNSYSLTSYLLMILILLTGNAYGKVNQLFGLSGMKIASESFYSKTVVPNVDTATNKVFLEF